MRASSPSRVLIVAYQTADSPELLEAVARRVDEGPCTFTLLVPTRAPGLRGARERRGHPAPARRRNGWRWRSRSSPRRPARRSWAWSAPPSPSRPCRTRSIVLGFDEVIISMLPVRLSRWFRLDLPRKVRALGVPVTEVITTAREADPTAA